MNERVDGKRKIILVDDDLNVLDALVRVLRNERYELIKCKNAKEAWDILIHEKGDIDIIISDNKSIRFCVERLISPISSFLEIFFVLTFDVRSPFVIRKRSFDTLLNVIRMFLCRK